MVSDKSSCRGAEDLDTIHTIPKNRRQSPITLRHLSLWLLRCLCRWGQTDRIWCDWNKEKQHKRVKTEINVKDRSAGRRLLEITVVSGQSCEVTSYGKLQYADWNTLHSESTGTHLAVPMTCKHWASECDRQEQQGDAAVTAVSQFRQEHVCEGCSPVTNSEACLHPRSFIHQQHVANSRKNGGYLPRHRDFSHLSLEPGSAVTVPVSNCVLHTAQYLWVEVFVVLPFIWVQLIQQQNAKPWDSSLWHGVGATGGKQSCGLLHSMAPKDEHKHWKGLSGTRAKDTQEVVV